MQAPSQGPPQGPPKADPKKPPVIEFPVALWEDLAKVDPAVAAREAKARLIEGRFEVDFLGAPHLVDPEARLVTAPPGRPRANFQKALVLVKYLAQAGLACAPPPAGRLAGPMELPGGAMFFRGPHALSTKPLEKAYRDDKRGLLEKALSLGAEAAEGTLFRWRVLPNIDVACYFEEADEEFGAQARYAFDAHAHYHLPLDGLWAMINVVTSELLPDAPKNPEWLATSD